MTQAHRRGLRIGIGNGEGVLRMRPPLTRRCLDEIRLGKACDSFLPIQCLCPNHYHRCTLISHRTHTHLPAGRVRLENSGVKGAPQNGPLCFPPPQRTLILRLRLHLRLVLPHFLLRHPLPTSSWREKQPCTQQRSARGSDGNKKKKNEKRNGSGRGRKLPSWKKR